MEDKTNIKTTARRERSKPLVCPRCGGTDFMKRGKDSMIGGDVQRYQCKNRKCHKITQGEWIDEPQENAAAALKTVNIREEIAAKLKK